MGGSVRSARVGVVITKKGRAEMIRAAVELTDVAGCYGFSLRSCSLTGAPMAFGVPA